MVEVEIIRQGRGAGTDARGPLPPVSTWWSRPPRRRQSAQDLAGVTGAAKPGPELADRQKGADGS